MNSLETELGRAKWHTSDEEDRIIKKAVLDFLWGQEISELGDIAEFSPQDLDELLTLCTPVARRKRLRQVLAPFIASSHPSPIPPSQLQTPIPLSLQDQQSLRKILAENQKIVALILSGTPIAQSYSDDESVRSVMNSDAGEVQMFRKKISVISVKHVSCLLPGQCIGSSNG